MKPHSKSLPACLTALILSPAALSAQGTTFTWTGGKEATPWYDTANWDANGAPNQTDGGGSGTTLGTEEADALVVFNSETATNNYMPTETINVSTDWFGGGTSDHLIPSLQVLNGTINLGSPGAQWWHYAGGTVYQIGDGDLTTAAQMNTGFNNWTRHFDRGGGFLMTINADGTLNQTGNFQLTNSPVTITLNGGTFVSAGTVTGLAGNSSRVINFDASGSSFTARFGDGTSTDFADLAAVNAEIGASFIDNTTAGLVATDNGDGTFTVELAGAALITSFEAAGATGLIDQTAGTIALEVPAGTDLATLAPTFTLTSGNCDQTSGSPPSPTFAAQNPVDYVVTDTSTDPDTINTYSVTVTVDTPDLTPPAISSSNPANGATEVPKGTNLELTFDEDIAVATGFITLKNLTTATEIQIDVTDGSQVSVAGAVLTINPSADLALGDQYAVQIDANAIEDLASPANGFAGITDDNTWSFTVFLGNYIWTGGKEATPWHDSDNWGSGGAPTQGTSLGTPEQDALVVFDSETATNGYMPTDTITVDADWNSSEHLMPAVQVRNGTINLAGPGGDWWHYAGGNVFQVGDGDMTTAAQVNTSFTNWVRHLDKGGKNLITINADGTINQSANFQFGQNGDTEMTLNGGTFISSGTIKGLATRAGSLVNFNADGSTFTAPFGDGVDTDFADLAAVNAAIGTSFVDNTTGGVLLAQDNGDGTFTVGFLAASMTSFEAAGVPGTINQAAKTIDVEVPFGTDLATLAPTFTLSSGTCDQTSGAAPSPTFADQNPATYTVTDTSTDPDTVNTYTVTVTVGPQIGTLVIDLGAGTAIEGGTFGSHGTNLPLPSLPAGSILRSIAINTVLEATDNGTDGNWASDLSILLDPTPGTPGGDFAVEITSGTNAFTATLPLNWPTDANAGPGTTLVDTKTDADFGTIDLATTGLFLGNAFVASDFVAGQGGTWSGTITLTYDIPSGGSDYPTWAAGFLPDDVSDPSGDLDGDGLTNNQERAFGLDPTDPASVDPFIVPINAGGSFSYTRRDPALSGLTYSIWTSPDLDNWTEDTGATQTPGTVANEVQTVAVTPSATPVGGKLFVQVRAD